MGTATLVRPAKPSDSQTINKFLKRSAFLHRHLDWLSPLEWLDYTPYLILENNGRIKSILVCPPEVNGIYWIRIFSNLDAENLHGNFGVLFQSALKLIHDQCEHPQMACLVNQDWMLGLLNENRWNKIQDVVQLKWNPDILIKDPQSINLPILIRPMKKSDLKRVTYIDHLSFQPLWQHSEYAIKNAFEQSSYATVCERDQVIVGYQISTSFQYRAHIARLAVLPEFQGKQLGMALVTKTLDYFRKPWIKEITVNTQSDNQHSLRLYQKLGFEFTQDSYPILSFEKKDHSKQ